MDYYQTYLVGIICLTVVVIFNILKIIKYTKNIQELEQNIKNERLYVLNKADRVKHRVDYRKKFSENADVLVISAKKSTDIRLLSTALAAKLMPLNHAEGSVIITRQRHRQAIQAAHDALCRALKYDFHDEPELAAEDFRLAAAALGRVTGEIDIEEVLGSIFSAFCIGK